MSAPSRHEPNYDWEPIPERDLRVLSVKGGAFVDVLKWAYALGRVQGQIEGTDEATAMLRRANEETA